MPTIMSAASQDGGYPQIRRDLVPVFSSDLHDWLRLTHWHDTDFREKELGNYRKKVHTMSTSQVVKYQSYDQSGYKENGHMPATVAEATRGPETGRMTRRDRVDSNGSRGRSMSPSYRNGYINYRVRDKLEFSGMDRGQPRIDHGLEDTRDPARERLLHRRPKSFEVGERGTVRFFVMRSGSWHNIYKSMEDGVWATNVSKAEMLSEALSKGTTVVLFFAVNHSHGFQGYAIMKSAPSKDVYHPRWWHDVKWPISEPFTVDWIVTRHVMTTRVSHIVNGLNYDLPVTRSANGQELSFGAGLQMVKIMNAHGREAVANEKRYRRITKTTGV
ncbi:YTH-domain-containing protein [Rostrohypoxylon terebratum]|nr:YTH-domain-containing protein [Rostrohypoxylon terebratum]